LNPLKIFFFKGVARSIECRHNGVHRNAADLKKPSGFKEIAKADSDFEAE